jgi:hypothetical protein
MDWLNVEGVFQIFVPVQVYSRRNTQACFCIKRPVRKSKSMERGLGYVVFVLPIFRGGWFCRDISMECPEYCGIPNVLSHNHVHYFPNSPSTPFKLLSELEFLKSLWGLGTKEE